MKITIRLPLILTLLALPLLVVGQNTRFTDPDTVIKDHFWGALYAEGGNSFFCNTPFMSKGFTLTDGYVYPLSIVRSALRCGTPSQCSKNDQYRHIAADLHNMVPVHTRIEMRRRNARYEELGAGTSAGDCDIRESTQFIEPPVRVKGDVARTVAYMVDAYGLPWVGAVSVFKAWNELDPPDDRELTRHNRIVEIQGNENRYITNPSLMAGH